MEYVVLLGLLLFKHGVLAHVVDWGYSASRRPPEPNWHVKLLGHCVAEGMVTYLLLLADHVTCGVVPLVLVMELVALVASSMVERRAPFRRLIEYHVVCEVAVLLVYAMAVAFVVTCN